MPINLPQALRDTVRANDEGYRHKTVQAASAQADSDGAAASARGIRSTMGWREKWFAGWFGGDRDKVARYREKNTLSETFNAKAGTLRAEAQGCDLKANAALDGFLRKNDPDYQLLAKPADAAAAMKRSVNDFLGTIDSALKEIDDAQSMETMDLFSKNKGIAVMSYLETSEAKDAIRRVESAAAPFQKAVNAYNDTLRDYKAPQTEVPGFNGTDIIFDLAFDGFDFMSIFALSALENAEESMRKARNSVVGVDRVVTANLEKAQGATNAYVKHIREACL